MSILPEDRPPGDREIGAGWPTVSAPKVPTAASKVLDHGGARWAIESHLEPPGTPLHRAYRNRFHTPPEAPVLIVAQRELGEGNPGDFVVEAIGTVEGFEGAPYTYGYTADGRAATMRVRLYRAHARGNPIFAQQAWLHDDQGERQLVLTAPREYRPTDEQLAEALRALDYLLDFIRPGREAKTPEQKRQRYISAVRQMAAEGKDINRYTIAKEIGIGEEWARQEMKELGIGVRWLKKFV